MFECIKSEYRLIMYYSIFLIYPCIIKSVKMGIIMLILASIWYNSVPEIWYLINQIPATYYFSDKKKDKCKNTCLPDFMLIDPTKLKITVK